MAEKKYEIDIFDLKELKTLENQFSDLQRILQSEEFMNFLRDKCISELNDIINKKDSANEYAPQMQEYRDSNKSEVTKDTIKIYNDSMVDLSHVSEKTRLKYTSGLSLAKLIEFGTGIPRNN